MFLDTGWVNCFESAALSSRMGITSSSCSGSSTALQSAYNFTPWALIQIQSGLIVDELFLKVVELFHQAGSVILPAAAHSMQHFLPTNSRLKRLTIERSAAIALCRQVSRESS